MKLWKIAIAVVALGCYAAPAWAAGRAYVSANTLQTAWAPTATQAVGIGNAARPSMVGKLSESYPLRIVVGLNMRDRAGADRMVRRQHTLGDPYFHRWLTPAQFTATFNPTYAQAAAVAAYLQRQGFTNIAIEPNHLMVTATGSP